MKMEHKNKTQEEMAREAETHEREQLAASMVIETALKTLADMFQLKEYVFIARQPCGCEPFHYKVESQESALKMMDDAEIALAERVKPSSARHAH
jgi:hypothetical protein